METNIGEEFKHDWRTNLLKEYVLIITEDFLEVRFDTMTLDQQLKVIELAIQLLDGDIKDMDNSGFANLIENLASTIRSSANSIEYSIDRIASAIQYK